MEKINEILEKVRPGVDFHNAKNLIEEGVLDSFDIVMLVGELNDEFDIQITVEDLLPENFNSVEAISKLVLRLEN